MKESNTIVNYVRSNFHRRKKLCDTKGKYMKESNTLAGSAGIKQLQREILLNTKEQCMTESNTLAGSVGIKQLQREILLPTKEQYMMESNTLADNVGNNFLTREIWQDTIDLYIKANRHCKHTFKSWDYLCQTQIKKTKLQHGQFGCSVYVNFSDNERYYVSHLLRACLKTSIR